jgi:hypothetical protein
MAVDSTSANAAAETTSLTQLPHDALRQIAKLLLPATSFGAAPHQWRDALSFGGAALALLLALADALREDIPAMRRLGEPDSAVAWLTLVRQLHMGGGGRWLRVRPLRAVRAQSVRTVPMSSPPQLSGGTLCAISRDRLALFGGRSSLGGETLDRTCLVQVTWTPSRADHAAPRAVAVWDALTCEPARCYHAAALWGEQDAARMVVFGGAGAGDVLLNDLWAFHADASADEPVWTELHPDGVAPAPRSSHICARWAEEGALLVHGGLGSAGVTGDVFVLRPLAGRGCAWAQLETRGADVRRAHHCGGIVPTAQGAALLVFSGQDEGLLTVHSIATLALRTATWSLVGLPAAGPAGAPCARIDGAAATVDGVGVLVFGGVGDDFAFVESADAWLLSAETAASPRSRAADGAADGAPLARACLALCADGLRVYMFGGFDGEADVDELSCLSLLPPAFCRAVAPPAGDELRVAEFHAGEFRARQARQATVLHATPGAAGHNFQPIHVRVAQAGRAPVQ